MANLTEDELDAHVAVYVGRAVTEERERCAWLCEELARIHERGAVRTRKAGSYTTTALWPLGKRVTCIKPGWERVAQAQEGAARSLRIVANGVREGWNPTDKIKAESEAEDWGNVGTEAGS